MKGSGKVFSSGGDVIQISSSPYQKVLHGYRYSAKTVELLSNYKIPFIVFIDGLAMGGAATYCTPGKYRVVTERTSFAMPETSIGLINDASSNFFLSRLPRNFGTFMGMTGYRVKGYDMLKVGLGSHFIENSKLDDLETELIECRSHKDVTKVLDCFASAPQTMESELDTNLPLIEKCFSALTVEGIFENLREDGSEWATKTLKTLNRMSPTSLKVTHRNINLGRNLSLRECLKMEIRIVHNLLTSSSDFKEGIRAAIEKDNNRNWQPKTINEVSDEHVESFLKLAPVEYETCLEHEPCSRTAKIHHSSGLSSHTELSDWFRNFLRY